MNEVLNSRGQRARRRIVNPILHLVHLLISATAWVIFVSAYALSGAIFLHWGRFVFAEVVLVTPVSPKELIHSLLLSIEMLILVPAPALVGMVAYKTLIDISQPHQQDLAISEHQLKVAESLLAGLLISVTGMTLLDSIFTESVNLELFLCGSLLMAVLAGVLVVYKNR